MRVETCISKFLVSFTFIILFIPMIIVADNVEVERFQEISDVEGMFTATIDASDHIGNDLVSIPDINGDGVRELIIGAVGDDDGGSESRGAVYVVFINGTSGNVSSFQKISDTAGGFNFSFVTFQGIGRGLANIGDFDGDGVADFLMEDTANDIGLDEKGSFFIMRLYANGSVKSYNRIGPGLGNFSETIEGGDQFAHAMDSIGDFDGDGVTDFAIGARGEDDGTLYIMYMHANGSVREHVTISDTEGHFNETFTSDMAFGRGIANMGDMDGDGTTDLAVGANGAWSGPVEVTGAFFILFLYPNGTVKDYTKIAAGIGGGPTVLSGSPTSDRFGTGIANIGDINGDGINDTVVSALFGDDGATNNGEIYIMTMQSNGSVQSLSKISDTAGFFKASFTTGDRLGLGVTNMGDLDGNGMNDIAVGAAFADKGGTEKGVVYVMYLRRNVFREPTPAATTGLTFTGSINSTISNKTHYDAQNITIYNGSRPLVEFFGLFNESNVNFEDFVVEENGTVVALNSSLVTGVASEHTIYLPNNNGGIGVFVCPSAITVAEVVDGCTGQISFSGPFPETVSGVTVRIDGSNYKIEGVTGSGAAPNGGSPPAVPEMSTWMMIIVMSIAMVSFVYRRRKKL